jgi:type IX secretion system PorP/SprF family membrane protein
MMGNGTYALELKSGFKHGVRTLLALCFTICNGIAEQELCAQDPEFTQFFNNPIQISPAYAGAFSIQGNIVPAPRLTSGYRKQWPRMSGAYVTSGVTFDTYVRALSGGLALRVLNDDAGRGTLSWSTVGAAYNFRTKVAPGWYLNLALEAAYFQRFLDWNKLSFGDMIDPSQGFIYTTQDVYREGFVSGSTFRAGGLIHSKKWSLGVVGGHLNKPNESVTGGTSVSIIPIKLTVHGSGTIGVTDKPRLKSYLHPQFLFHQQGDQRYLNIGANFTAHPTTFNSGTRKIFSTGMWYRGLVTTTYRDAFMFYTGVEAVGWKVGYSYDLTFSQLTPATGGAHEINLTLYLPTVVRRRFFCPDCDWEVLNTDEWHSTSPQVLLGSERRDRWWTRPRKRNR